MSELREMNGSAPLITFIMPAFNEEATIEKALDQTHLILESMGISYELIVIDDGSYDCTSALIRQSISGWPNARLISHSHNSGLGTAIRTGILAGNGEFIVFMPVDSPLEKDEIERYLAAFLPKTDAVVGCRHLRLGYNYLMRFNSFIYPKLVQILFNVRIKDFNWIHMYRRRIFPRALNLCEGIFGPTEILIRISRAGGSIREIDVNMKERKAGSASASRVRVMIRTLAELIYFRLIFRG